MAAAVQPGWLGQGVCRDGTAGRSPYLQPQAPRLLELPSQALAQARGAANRQPGQG
ncbi:hypothetical protein DUNSADRAFT_1031 [Dunaliella salina]|uniref:Encoded protein n=1 Tax=Dunaliella salina TaxID=3046 RepID=A0ABQ7GXK9_DUNSA|nr:hypothetical protein DUNSADRAFT_1031 [Dunaliella salina]|eukprot:KAF5839347.1 hypothetical protein DUNSADRAFT_1031 [Dunaliella salina]